MTGKAVFIEKKEKKNAILIYILIANLFTLEHAFFIAKLSYTISNSFIITITLFLEYCLAKSRISLSNIIDSYFQFHFLFAITELFLSVHFLQLYSFWNFVQLETHLFFQN